MTVWGGYLLGIALAILLYVGVHFVERDYYKRKLEAVRRKQERINNSEASSPPARKRRSPDQD